MPFLLLAMSLISVWSLQTPDLKHFQWKNRILLVFSSNEENALVKQQTALIDEHSSGCLDRDLITFIVPENSPLHQRFHVPGKAFTVILLGKDGTEKLRQRSVLQPEKLFALIDSMPMRQAGGR